jgi:aminoglycoside 3'-phosphotransferase-2
MVRAPLSWDERLAGYRWRAQDTGCSEADVFRLDADGRPSLFVKREPVAPLAELRAYGVGMDAPRRDFYRLLDEFF